MRRLHIDLTRVCAGVIEHKTPYNQHVGRHVTDLSFLHVVLLIAVDNLIDNVVDLNTIITRQHRLRVLVDPLDLHRHTRHTDRLTPTQKLSDRQTYTHTQIMR